MFHHIIVECLEIAVDILFATLLSLRKLYTWSMNTCLGLREALGFMSSLLAAPAPRRVTDPVYVAVLKAPALSRAINSDDLGITNLSPQNTFQQKYTFCLLEILRIIAHK